MKGQRGFTLIELLVSVAIIGMLASIAIPGLRAALRKAKRNAAVHSLRVMRDAMSTYNADFGSYPSYFRFNSSDLTPLTPLYVPKADPILRNFKGAALDFYLPWNVFESTTITMDTLFYPDSYTCYATLKYDPDIRFLLTDATTWMWEIGRSNTWLQVGEN